MRKLILATLPLIAITGCSDPASNNSGGSRKQMKIVGSSTVYPFAKAVAEKYSQAGSDRSSPSLESTGSGGGIELFCAGVGIGHPDIVNSSRRMKPGEFERCLDNGVDEVIELVIGIDGIVVVQPTAGPQIALSTEQLYKAVAAKPFDESDSNGYKKWSDIDGKLPGINIAVYGPPKTSGTRDSLTELLMEPGCLTSETIKQLKSSDKSKFEIVCHEVRSDGGYIETGENDNLIVKKLTQNEENIGIFGYSYFEENADVLRAIAIDGVEPSYDKIASGAYPGGRPLYVYVKKKHMDIIPGMADYLNEFLSAGAPDGYLKAIGLITAPDTVRREMAEKLNNRTLLTVEDLQ